VRSKAKTEKVYLTNEQLSDLRKHKPSSKSLEKVKDLFLFASYTGLRHNELMRLTSADIQKRDGYRVLIYNTSKNNKVNEVPLNKVCEKIIDRWSKESMLLPTLSVSKCNIYIHQLLKEMEMDTMSTKVYYIGGERVEQVLPMYDLVTFHVSRHSYISNMIEAGMSVQEVSDLVGVSVITLVNHYSHSNKKLRNDKAIKILNQI
jgi:integrase